MATGNLTIVVHRANNLPESSFLGKDDPYVLVRLDTQDARHAQRGKYQSKESRNPTFEQKFAFFLNGNERNIILEIWDDDYLKDDKLAQATISIQELLQHTDQRPFIVNLMSKKDRSQAGTVELSVIADNLKQGYGMQGSQVSQGTGIGSGLSSGIGSGLGMGSGVSSSSSPYMGQQQQQQSYVQQDVAGATGNLTVIVHRAFNLPESNFLSKNDPYVRMRLDTQSNLNAQKGKHQKDGSTNPTFEQKFAFFLNGNERSLILEIWDDDFIKDDKLAYAIIPIQELLQHNDQRPFAVNLINKSDRNKAGMAELSVIADNIKWNQQGVGSQESILQKVARKVGLASGVTPTTATYSSTEPTSDYWKGQVKSDAIGTSGNMTIAVHRAINLPKSGFFGKNDPYVKIRLDTQNPRQAQRGKHQSNSSTNPVFDQYFAFFLNGNESVVCLEIWDDDYLKDDKLAYAIIPIRDILQHNDGRPFMVNLMAKGDRGDAGMVELSVIADSFSQNPLGGQGLMSSLGQSSSVPHESTMQKIGRKMGLSNDVPSSQTGYDQYGTTGMMGTGMSGSSGMVGSTYQPNVTTSSGSDIPRSSYGHESTIDKGMRKLGIGQTGHDTGYAPHDTSSGYGYTSGEGKTPYLSGSQPSYGSSSLGNQRSSDYTGTTSSGVTGYGSSGSQPSYGSSSLGSQRSSDYTGTTSSGVTGYGTSGSQPYGSSSLGSQRSSDYTGTTSSGETQGTSVQDTTKPSMMEKVAQKLGINQSPQDKAILDQGVTVQGLGGQYASDKPK